MAVVFQFILLCRVWQADNTNVLLTGLCVYNVVCTPFRYYAGIAIGCVLLLVISLLYLGLLFGVFGNEPDEYEEQACSSATGTDFLIASVPY